MLSTKNVILIAFLCLTLGLQASDIRSDEVRGAHFLTQLGSIPYTTAITGVVNQDVAAGTALCRDTVTGALGIGACAVPAGTIRLNLADVSGVNLTSARLSATADADGETVYGIWLASSTGNTATATANRVLYGIYNDITANSGSDATFTFYAAHSGIVNVIDSTTNAAFWRNVQGSVAATALPPAYFPPRWTGNNTNLIGHASWLDVGGAGSFGTGFDAYVSLRNDDGVAQGGYSFNAYASGAGPTDTWHGLRTADAGAGAITGGTGYGYRCEMDEGTWTDAWCLYTGDSSLRSYLGSHTRLRDSDLLSTSWRTSTEGGCAAAVDLAVDAVNNRRVTSATYTFVAADVGGLVQILGGAGWTVGYYTIDTVAAGAAILENSPAPVGTANGLFDVNRGRTILVQGAAGVADTFRVCTKDAANVYAWRALI